MTDQQHSWREQRAAIATIGKYWRGWSADRTDAYQSVLATYPPDVIRAGVDLIARDWKALDPPGPHHVIEACERCLPKQPVAPTSVGVGCPRCRDVHGDSLRPSWIGVPERNLVSCPDHRYSWRGVLTPRQTPQEAAERHGTANPTNHPHHENQAVKTAYSASTGEAA